MTIEQYLELFYKENGIPPQGGEDKKTFMFKVFGININLPNPEFRREALHIHDIQHIVLNKNTSWKGESYITGWEIATGMWKHFFLGMLGLWAMG